MSPTPEGTNQTDGSALPNSWSRYQESPVLPEQTGESQDAENRILLGVRPLESSIGSPSGGSNQVQWGSFAKPRQVLDDERSEWLARILLGVAGFAAVCIVLVVGIPLWWEYHHAVPTPAIQPAPAYHTNYENTGRTYTTFHNYAPNKDTSTTAAAAKEPVQVQLNGTVKDAVVVAQGAKDTEGPPAVVAKDTKVAPEITIEAETKEEVHIADTENPNEELDNPHEEHEEQPASAGTGSGVTITKVENAATINNQEAVTTQGDQTEATNTTGVTSTAEHVNVGPVNEAEAVAVES